MRNRLTYIIAAVLIIATAGVIIYRQTSTIKKELRDFAVPDTAQVDKIFMADKLNNTVILERNGKDWIVNGKYSARKDAIYILLKTIARIDIKSPVPKSMMKTVISQMAARHVKVEIYKNGEKFKVYFVGGPSADEQGTFMMLENSSTPFIVQIPGFFGYLSTRFFTEENMWRDQGIFRVPFKEINYVKVDYPQEKTRSYTVNNLGPNKFSLTVNGTAVTGLDTTATKEFLGRFSNICFESVIQNFDNNRADSLLKSIPYAVITVHENNGKERKLTLWRMRNVLNMMLYDGTVPEYNLDAMYGRIDNENVFITVQYFVMDPVLKEPSYFIYKANN